MKRAVVSISLIVSLLLITVVIYLLFTLNSKRATLDVGISQTKLELLTESDHYTKCYNSINYGSSMVGDISLSHLRFDSSDIEKARLDSIETEFMNNVKQRCGDTVANYEKKYQKLSNDVSELENSDWISFLIGGRPMTSEQVNDLSPEMVRFKAGDPLTHFVFTKEDVEQYFIKRL